MEERHLPLGDAWRRELRAGLQWLREGRFDRAEAHFVRAHEHAPERPEVCFALGRERLRRGQVAEAEMLLRTAWDGDPTLATAAASLARCLALHQGRYREAEAILDQAGERLGPLPLFELVRSELLLDEGNVVAARTTAEAALAGSASDPSTARAARAALARVHNHEGIALAERGELEPALFAFKRAADCDPEWASPHVNIGAAFVNLGKRKPARAALETALVNDPDNPLAHLDLGLLLAGEDDRAARRHFERALEIDPDLGEARAALAELLIVTGDADGACALLAGAVERNPDNPDPWVAMGSALAAAGDREGAETCLRHALDLEPEHAGACHYLADLLARDGRYLEAAVIAQRARSLDSDPAPDDRPSTR